MADSIVGSSVYGIIEKSASSITDQQHAVRSISPLLSAFPWSSNLILERRDLRTTTNSTSPWANYIQAIQNFEDTTVARNTDQEGAHWRHLLRLQLIGRQLAPSHGGRGNHADWGEVCSLVCGYRLVETIARVKDGYEQLSRKKSKNASNIPRPLLKYGSVENWPVLLMSFKDTKLSMPIQQVEVGDANRHIVLARYAASNKNEGDLKYICNNLFVASMHLSFLRTCEFKQGEIPELYDVLQKVMEVKMSLDTDKMSELLSTMLTQSESKYWIECFNKSADKPSKKKERNPLVLALLISPIYLFVPMTLTSKIFGRENVLMLSDALGNEKPTALVHTEDAIWKVLLGLAEGTVHPDKALSKLLDSMPWKEIEGTSASDSKWFDFGQSESTYSNGLSRLRNSQAQEVSKSPNASGGSGLQINSAFMQADQERNILLEYHTISDPALEEACTKNTSPHSEILDPLASDGPNSSEDNSSDVSAPENTANTAERDSRYTQLIDTPQESEVRTITKDVLDVTSSHSAVSSTVPGSTESTCDDPLSIDLGKISASVSKKKRTPRTRTGKSKPRKKGPGSKSDQIEAQSFQKSLAEATTAAYTKTIPTIDQLIAVKSTAAMESKTNKHFLGNSYTPQNSSYNLRSVQQAASNDAGGECSLNLDEATHTNIHQEGDQSGQDEPPRKKQKIHHTSELYQYLASAGSASEPIDVERYALFNEKSSQFKEEEVWTALSDLRAVQRYTLPAPIRVWNAGGIASEIRPRFHFADELVKVTDIILSSDLNLLDNKPKFLSDPTKSAFRVIDYKTYKGMNSAAIQRHLRDQCLVVRDMPWDDVSFESGLEELAASDEKISIQDNSIPMGSSGTGRIVVGTRRDILQASELGARGKSLNGLGFPLHCAEFEDGPYASCRTAWRNTAGTLFKRSAEMPVSDIHFGLAATSNVASFWHIDSDGLGTVVDVRSGAKLWIVASGQQEQYEQLGLLLTSSFEIDQAPQYYPTEAILLEAKTRLIMRPNTVHSVYTPVPTICRGSHFYSIACMQSTFASMVHGFVCHKYITNISHPDTRTLLRRLAHFCHRGLVLETSFSANEGGHLPILPTKEGDKADMKEVLNLLYVCALGIFANALDPRSYTTPNQDEDREPSEEQRAVLDVLRVNAIPRPERTEICVARSVCIDTINWFRDNFDASLDGAAVDLVSILLVQLARVILRYKYIADANQIESAGRCTLGHLEQELNASLELDLTTHSVWSRTNRGGKWQDEEITTLSNIDIRERDKVDMNHLQGSPRIINSEGDIVIPETIHIPRGKNTSLPSWTNERVALMNADRYTVKRRHSTNCSERIAKSHWPIRGQTALDSTYFEAMENRDKCKAMVDQEFIRPIL